MKKYLHLALLLFVFAGFAKAQGPQSTANWFGYILPSSPAAYKYVSFTMQDLGSVSIASDEYPAVSTATFADGYVWSVNDVYGYCLYRSSFDAANNRIEDPQLMVEDVPYFNDMVYNPADGRIYVITGEHLKSFDPAAPSNMQDHGAIVHDGFNLAIDMEGNAYMISSWGEFGTLNLSNAQLTVINSIDLPLKMSFDMLTGELFGVFMGNLYQIDPNTGVYTQLGALHDANNSYDPTCLFMTYGSAPSEFTVGDLIYRVNEDQLSVTVIGHVDGYEATGDLIIPESVSYGGHNYTVTTIGESAFLYCFYLTNLSLPNTITTIEASAFAYCQGFTGDLVIPNSVTYIGENAFAFCYDLTGDLTIPNSVDTIDAGAFFYCEGFDGILTIGESVTFIGDQAFRNCSGFTGAVTLATTPPALGDDFGGMVFENFGSPILVVPCGCVEAYQNSSWYEPYGLNGFSEFVEDCTAVSEANGVGTAVYPNPTYGKVRIEAEGIQSIGIFNLLGEKVFDCSANGDVFEYDFGHQEAGIYIIQVVTTKGVESIRVIVR